MKILMTKPIEIQIQNADPTKMSVADAVKNMREEISDVLEIQKYQAKIKRAYFKGLVESGFTEDQAMWLIK
jgi:hypothetical protein